MAHGCETILRREREGGRKGGRKGEIINYPATLSYLGFAFALSCVVDIEPCLLVAQQEESAASIANRVSGGFEAQPVFSWV